MMLPLSLLPARAFWERRLIQLLRRDLQKFDSDDVQIPSRGVDGSNETCVNISGRTVILQQKKDKMGAYRFILEDVSLVEDYKKRITGKCA
jgi:hypothetical protein